MTITAQRREKILKIADGEITILPIIHQIERMPRREQIYDWLIRNQLVGKKFFAFAAERKCSWLRIAKDILAKIDGERKQIIAGKDVL